MQNKTVNDYIERKLLLKALEELKEGILQVDKYTLFDVVCDVVKTMPTVEV